jgi:hypothetical protein
MHNVIAVFQVKLTKAWNKAKEVWTKLTDFDKGTITIVGLVTGGTLLFTNGIAFSAALFGVLMVANFTLLCAWVPPLAEASVNHRGKLDVGITILGMAYGFLSGQVTTVASFIFFGFIASAVLRGASGAKDEIAAWSSEWKQLNPKWAKLFNRRKEVVCVQ